MSWADDNLPIGMEDMAFEALCGSDCGIDTEKIQDILWVCKDGTEIFVSEMTTSHIKNCIRMIEKSIEKGNPWRECALPFLKEELENRMFLQEMRNMSNEEFLKMIHKGKI